MFAEGFDQNFQAFRGDFRVIVENPEQVATLVQKNFGPSVVAFGKTVVLFSSDKSDFWKFVDESVSRAIL